MTIDWLLWLLPAALLYLMYAWFSGAEWLCNGLLRLEQARSGLRLTRVRAGGSQFQLLTNTPLQQLQDGDDRRPVLMLLHGFGGDYTHWLRVSPHLGRHFRLVIPDLPGFGGTALPAGETGTMEEQAERLHALIERLDITQLYLGGNSMGAYLAAVYAHRYPDQIIALWLLNPGGVHGGLHTPLLEDAVLRGENRLIATDARKMKTLSAAVFVREPWVPRPITRRIIRSAAHSQPMWEQLFDDLANRSTPLEELAPQLPPTLLVWGDTDQVLHPDGAEVLRPLLQQSQIQILPQTGHCPMIEHPARVATDWLQFVTSRQTALT
ncbi:MAG: alpha/beta fold hydrolase [Wenzhouxiangellaceae bacterium]